MPAPVLLLASDEQATHVVSQILGELSLEVIRPDNALSGVREVEQRSFGALVVDCDDIASAKLMFDASRRSKFNQGIPTIALASGGTGLPTAFRLGAQFVITKPASLDQVRHTLRAACSKIRKDAGSSPAAQVTTAPAPQRASAAAANASSATSTGVPGTTLNSAPVAPSANPVPPAAARSARSAPVQSAGFAVAAAPARVAPTSTVPKSVADESTPARTRSAVPDSKSDDPILADLDDMESPGGLQPPPFTQLKMKPRTPMLAFFCVMTMLAGAGGYAAWMMRPDFRDFVMYEYVKVRALIGKPVPQPVPQSVPVQPKPAPAQTAPPAAPVAPEGNVDPATGAPEGSTGLAPASETAAPAVAPAVTAPPPRAVPAANPQH